MLDPRGRSAWGAILEKALLLAGRGSHLALNLCDHALKAGHLVAHGLQGLVLSHFRLEKEVGQGLRLFLSKLLDVELPYAQEDRLETLIDILLEAELGGSGRFRLHRRLRIHIVFCQALKSVGWQEAQRQGLVCLDFVDEVQRWDHLRLDNA